MQTLVWLTIALPLAGVRVGATVGRNLAARTALGAVVAAAGVALLAGVPL